MSQKTLNLCLERYNFVKFGETAKSTHTVLCTNNAYSVNSDNYRLTPTAVASKHGEGYVFTLNYDFDRPLFTIVQKSYALDGTSGNIVFEGIDPISKDGSKYLRKVTVSPVKLSDGSYLLEVTNDEYLRIGTTGAALGDEELESLNEKIVAVGGIEKSVETVGGKQVLKLDGSGPSGKEIVYFDIDPRNPPSGIYEDIGEALSNNKLPAIQSDGKLYLYTSTGTDRYDFVGVFSTDDAGYEVFTVWNNDTANINKLNTSLGYAALPSSGTEEHPAWAKVCELEPNPQQSYTTYGLALLFTAEYPHENGKNTESGILAIDVGSDWFTNSNCCNASWMAYIPGSEYSKILGVKLIGKYGVPSDPILAPYPIYKVEVWVKYYGSHNILVNALQNAMYFTGMVQGDFFKFPEGHIAVPQSTEPSYSDTEEYTYRYHFYPAESPSVAYTYSQSLTSYQKAQGRSNIGAASASDVTALQSQVSSLSDVSAYSAKGEATVAQLNAGPSGIQAGWAYQLTDSGTLTDGSLAVVAGDTVAWDGTKWFPLVKSDYYATKIYAQNVAHSIAPEFVPNSTTTVAGCPYMYNGVLYIAKEAYRGPWDASKFSAEYVAIRSVQNAVFAKTKVEVVPFENTNVSFNGHTGEISRSPSTNRVSTSVAVSTDVKKITITDGYSFRLMVLSDDSHGYPLRDDYVIAGGGSSLWIQSVCLGQFSSLSPYGFLLIVKKDDDSDILPSDVSDKVAFSTEIEKSDATYPDFDYSESYTKGSRFVFDGSVFELVVGKPSNKAFNYAMVSEVLPVASPSSEEVINSEDFGTYYFSDYYYSVGGQVGKNISALTTYTGTSVKSYKIPVNPKKTSNIVYPVFDSNEKPTCGSFFIDSNNVVLSNSVEAVTTGDFNDIRVPYNAAYFILTISDALSLFDGLYVKKYNAGEAEEEIAAVKSVVDSEGNDVGKILDVLKELVNLRFEVGAFENATGLPTFDASRLRTTDYVPESIKSYSGENELGIFAWDNNDNYVGFWNGSRFIKTSGIQLLTTIDFVAFRKAHPLLKFKLQGKTSNSINNSCKYKFVKVSEKNLAGTRMENILLDFSEVEFENKSASVRPSDHVVTLSNSRNRLSTPIVIPASVKCITLDAGYTFRITGMTDETHGIAYLEDGTWGYGISAQLNYVDLTKFNAWNFYGYLITVKKADDSSILPIDIAGKIAFRNIVVDVGKSDSADEFNLPSDKHLNLAAVRSAILDNKIPAPIGMLAHSFDGAGGDLYYGCRLEELEKIGSVTGINPRNCVLAMSPKDGTVIMAVHNSRSNLYVFKDGVTHTLDFSNEEVAPMGWLYNSGVDFIIDGDDNECCLFAEYNGNVTDLGGFYVWKGTYPYTSVSDWKRVFHQDFGASGAGTIIHFHQVKRDPWSNVLYLTSGDRVGQLNWWYSDDDGETWTKLIGDTDNDYPWEDHILRVINFLFTKDYIYFATDHGVNHCLNRVGRDLNGLIDVTSRVKLCDLPEGHATNSLCLVESPHGILSYERIDAGFSTHESDDIPMPFWNLETGTLETAFVMRLISPQWGGNRGKCYVNYTSMQLPSPAMGFAYDSPCIFDLVSPDISKTGTIIYDVGGRKIKDV